MSMKKLMIAILFLMTSNEIQAQSIKFHIDKPNCNPLSKRYDNPLIGVGWTMPRVGWHVLYPAVTLGIAEGIEYVSRDKVSPLVSTIGAILLVGLMPHIRGGIIRREYPIDILDWTSKLWNRSLPVWDHLSERNRSRRDLLTYLGGDLALSCFSHP